MRISSALLAGAMMALQVSVAAADNVVAPAKPQQAPVAAEHAPAPTPRTRPAKAFATAKLPQHIASFFEGNAGERFYLQSDKPLYQPGETIWFKAWELSARSLDDRHHPLAMIVELVSPKGAVVMKKKLRMEGGAAPGEFDLPEHAQGGEYTLRATAWDGQVFERNVIVSAYEAPRIKKTLEFVKKAYGAGDEVGATIEIKRPTGEVMGSKEIIAVARVDGVELPRVRLNTAADGTALVKFKLPARIDAGDGLLTILVQEGGVTESISKTIPIVQHKVALSFFPEGGDLVDGLPSRVYFAAKTPLGKPADVEGRVVDDLGNTVAAFATLKNGLGRTAFTPVAGRRYSAEISRPSGIAERTALPDALADGCVMRSYDDFDGSVAALRVAVSCTRVQKVNVLATARERLLDSATVLAGPARPGIAYLSSADPALQREAGIARVTVFDDNANPLAERLVFRNRRERLQVQVEPEGKFHAPRKEIGLRITTRLPSGKPVPAELALGVVDDTVLSFADDKSGNLLSKLLLEPELPGKVEEPNFYFDLTEEKSAAALDLLMGVRGYRRFDWQPVMAAALPAPPPKRPKYLLEITGSNIRRADKEVAMPVQVIVAEQIRQAPMVMPMAVMAAAPPPPAAVDAKRAPEPAVPAGLIAPVQADEGFLAAPAAKPMAIGGIAGFANLPDMDFARAAGKIAVHQEEWAPVRVFPVPVFQPGYAGPRNDFRDTVFWAPSVRTDANGQAHVKFVLSDAVTSFRVSTEGVGRGVPGRDETVFKSSLPFSLSAKLPLEVSAGDRPLVPVTLTNDSDQPQRVTLDAQFGELVKATGDKEGEQLLAPGESKSLFFPLEVADAHGPSQIHLRAASGGLFDEVVRTIPVASLGFPQLFERSGQIKGEAIQEIELSGARAGSVEASVRVYVSPLSSMVSGLEGMLRQPGGCFEQTSSTNYPNVMIMQYLRAHDVADPALISRTDKLLDSGYKMLTGFESQTKGYEWFGRNPGHEALTAYGLLEFADMQGVYGSVDPAMLARTGAWLKSRRDGKGGYLRDGAALDSFGRAGPAVTDAYITWALTTAGQNGLASELARSEQVAATTTDPYLLALTADTLLHTQPASASYKAGLGAAKRLAGMQAASGAWTGAQESITKSGGQNLDIETTALAILALLRSAEHMEQSRLGIAWLQNNRGGFGEWGATQATVLALKAMSAFDNATRVAPGPGTVSLFIDDVEVAKQSYPAGQKEALLFKGFDKLLASGKHSMVLKASSGSALPYSIAIDYRSTEPASSKQSVVGLGTELARTTLKMGETVRLTASVANKSKAGQPMALARIGIPAGLSFQNWQLKELREKGSIAFFETRPREVILYFDDLKPGEIKQIPFDLVATVPGSYTAPASSAYLYYNDTDKTWAKPLNVTISP